MTELNSRTSPLPWWIAGLLLGLVQVLAVALVKPMGVSKQFVVVDTNVLNRLAPEYSQNHPILSDEQYKKFGYDGWFNIGIIIGACFAALHLRVWKIRSVSAWWGRNHDAPILLRLIAGFCGGVLLLLGARLAYGCVTGQLISGWTQLSLSVIPFTIALFASGMLVAYLVYPKKPNRFNQEE